MNITFDTTGLVVCATVEGRLDAHGALQMQNAWKQEVRDETLYAVLEMSRVDYLSSAGLRTLMTIFKALNLRGGGAALAALQPYCRDVMEMAGFASSIPVYETREQALAYCHEHLRQKDLLARWDDLECIPLDCGTVRVIPAGQQPGVIHVLGDVKNILSSSVTASDLCSKRFSETEYSLGAGALGSQMDDYFPIMGEMITIGGTMVWLPTDGNDTPDFLIPKSDKGRVTIRTVFNVSLGGRFNELLMFHAGENEGVTISRLYRALFDLSKRRREDFRGILGIAMRAQLRGVLGSGIRKSPIADFTPANEQMITHPDNIAEWFDSDTTPRHEDVTGLICGIGADLTADLSSFDPEMFNKVFYLHPSNRGGKTELLHNHVVVFRKIPMPERAVNLDEEIRGVVEEGEFLDMRHLLDGSTVTKALIGVSYIQSFQPDPGGLRDA